MGKDTDPLSTQITRDHMSGLHCYTVSSGTTINHTKLSSQPPSVPPLPNAQMESPTYSYSSCDTSDASSSPGSWTDPQFNEGHLPLQVKDPKLQVYFFRMEKTLRTCHPAAIQAEALNLAQEIVANPVNIGTSIRTVAETLAKAGCRKVEYSRTCGLIAHEIFHQLRSTSLDASASFRDCLIDVVMRVFDGYYLGVNLWHLGGLNGLSSVEEEMINVVAFAGDLFALDLLPTQVVNDSILTNLAFANQVSTIHCRALHLFLLHAKVHVGPSIDPGVLSEVRKQLIRCIRGPPMAYDRMAQLWVIECCAVIEQTVEQDRLVCQGGGRPVAASHQWDKVLSKDGWFSALIA